MNRRLAAACSLIVATIVLASTGSLPTAHASLFGGDSVPRRVQAGIDSAAAMNRLIADITALVSIPEAKAGKVGVEIRSLTANRVLYSLNADRPLTPASTTKVVTAFTALSELGTNYQVRTILAAETKPQAGVLKGNLYVKGFGDPFLTMNDIDDLVDQLVNSGVKTVEGNVVGDGSFFDGKTERIQYSGDADVVVPLPPIAALTLPGSTFKLIISSSRIGGVPCNVQTYPSSSGFQIVNTAVTASPAPARRSGKRGSKRGAYLMEPDGTEPTAPLRHGRGAAAEVRFGDEIPSYQPPLDEHKPAKRAQATVTKSGTAKRGASRNGTTPKNTASKRTVQPTRKGGAKTTAAAPKKGRSTTARPARGRTAARATQATPRRVAASSVRREQTRTSAAPEPAVPKRGPLRVSVTSDENGKQIITVSGSLAPNRTVSYRYTMRNAPMVIAGIVYDRLRLNGITVSGTVTSGVTPAKYRMLAAKDKPLMEILQVMMKNSNNFLAEYVFKMIGAAAGGQQETARRSVEKIQQRMSTDRVPFGRCVINDGSGLSRNNCLTASALASILNSAHNNRKLFESFYGVMSIAGVDGTLRHRMRGTFAEKNVHGKTGTLNNVSALTGYVTTRDGDLFCFSMLMNGGNHGAYRSVQDKVAARLAAFSYKDTAPAAAAR